LRYSFALAPLAILPAIGALGGALSAAAARRRALAATVFLATVAGYGLFFYHGVAYGARFYYGAFPFLAILGGAGMGDLDRLLPPPWRAALAGLWLALVGVGLIATWPSAARHAGQGNRVQTSSVLASLRALELRDAVVFADSLTLPAAMTEHPGDIDANH